MEEDSGLEGGNRQRPRRSNIVLSRVFIPCSFAVVTSSLRAKGEEGRDERVEALTNRIPRDHARLRFPRIRARMAKEGGGGERRRHRPCVLSRSRLELTSNNGATLTRAPTCPIKGALFLPTGRDSTLPLLLLLLLLVMKIPPEDKIPLLFLF